MTIPILEDSVSESVEQFFARLTLVHSDADVQLVPDQAAIEIVDDDGMTAKKTLEPLLKTLYFPPYTPLIISIISIISIVSMIRFCLLL